MPYYGLVGNDDKALFLGRDEIHGHEPWVTNGTAAGTVLVKDIVAGTGSGTLTSFTTSEDAFLFGAASNGACSLFQSVAPVRDNRPFASFPQSIFVNLIKTFDHKTFYYTVINKDYSESLFKQTIGQGVPVEVKNFGFNLHNVSFSVREMVVTGTHAYMLIEAEGGDLWKSDGTPGGTIKVTDLYEASTLTATNNDIFLKARTAYGSPYKFYKSDGTATGTIIVKDVNGQNITEPMELAGFGNKLVFTSLSVQTGREVWIKATVQQMERRC